MAKIHEEIIAVKLSKLIKDDTSDDNRIADKDFIPNLEAIIQEMVGSSIVVEIITE